jgi:hypothetical protein
MDIGRSLRGKKLSLQLGTIIAGALLLVGLGVFVGVLVRGNSGSPGTVNVLAPLNANGSAVPAGARLIDMSKATGSSCRAPVHPGRGHPDTLVSQLFNVRDNQRTAYLLGWQIVPYQGAHTYDFGTAGNLLALEPPTGGRPLGFGSGTVTFSGNGDAGTVHALVRLRAGGSLSIKGNWVCSIPGQTPAKTK